MVVVARGAMMTVLTQTHFPQNNKKPTKNQQKKQQKTKKLQQQQTPSSIARQFDAFHGGFKILCDGPAIRLFNACEVERLVCGNPQLDFDALQRNAKYEGGFAAATPAVQVCVCLFVSCCCVVCCYCVVMMRGRVI